MRYLLILSIFLFGCSKEDEMILKSPYQLRMSWECTSISGYSCVTTDMFWTKQINLNNKIFYDIIPVYGNYDSNYQTFDVDITKLADTNNIKVADVTEHDTDAVQGLLSISMPRDTTKFSGGFANDKKYSRRQRLFNGHRKIKSGIKKGGVEKKSL